MEFLSFHTGVILVSICFYILSWLWWRCIYNGGISGGGDGGCGV